jgi:hypothetical protein
VWTHTGESTLRRQEHRSAGIGRRGAAPGGICDSGGFAPALRAGSINPVEALRTR